MSSTPKSLPTILIVDDIPHIRIYFRENLESFGHSCEEALHGLDAIGKLQTRHYDVVLTDVQMPYIDGFELAKCLKEDPSLGNPLVIMMTASNIELLAPLAREAGAKKIFSKPCRPFDIHQEIMSHQQRFPNAA
jgi:CheY-like chemotaxis protein